MLPTLFLNLPQSGSLWLESETTEDSSDCFDDLSESIDSSGTSWMVELCFFAFAGRDLTLRLAFY